MKTLQNNFTTPEQSKQLLELGVPIDSADMYYKHTMLTPYILSDRVLFSVYSKVEDIVPCWSVGRLIEICLKCSTRGQRQVSFFCDGDYDEYSLIDYIVTVLESGVMTSHMDFSKLED